MVDVERGHVEVEGGRLYYEASGEGSPVVLVHGGLWDLRMWDPQMEAFTSRHRVIRFDHRGYGRSDWPTQQVSWIDDMAGLFDRLGLERAAVVGLSMGGAVSIEFALAYPERLTSLVLAVTGVFGYPDWSDETKAAFARTDQAVEAKEYERAAQLHMELWCPMGSEGAGWDLIQTMSRENAGANALDDDLIRTPDPPAIDRAEEISAPTLIITADRDVPDMGRIGRMLASRLPDARHVEIEGADHAVNLRQPQAFNRAVLDFLS